MQLTVAVDPDEMFSEYLYVSGTSETLRNYFKWFAGFSIELKPNAERILDIACNDGSQLDAFKNLGLDTYGVDPARNLFDESSKNHKVICDFMNRSSIKRLGHDSFDIIVAQNVVAHTADPLELLLSAKEVLADDGVFLIQTSQADMVRNGEFDTIYHEHISFFCLNSMVRLAERAGLRVVDACKTPIHGHSWVFILRKDMHPSDRTESLLDDERADGLHSMETYQHYVDRCLEIQKELKDRLIGFRNDGYKLIGYGAAAKGMTLLNSIHESLDFIIDDNPLKIGLTAPGNMTPIVSRDILSTMPDDGVVFVPLAWNFFDEIRSRIKAVRDNDNDLYVRYFPKVSVHK